MNIVEWPPGHRLFVEGSLCMSFDPPEPGERVPALFLRKLDDNKVEILDIQLFYSDEAALEWFEEKCRDNVVLQTGMRLH